MRGFWLALMLLAAAPLAAAQGGVRLSPIALQLADGARTTSLRLHNSGDRARAFQVDPMRWTQADGADVLAPTRDLIVTPAVFEAPPGRTQIIRVALAPAVAQPARELAYRLLLREFALEDGPRAQGLDLRLEMSVPLFAPPPSPGAPALTAARAGDAVVISNEGDAHVRLSDVRAGADALRAPRYLLAGASFARPAPHDAPVRARVVTRDGGQIEMILSDAPAEPRGR